MGKSRVISLEYDEPRYIDHNTGTFFLLESYLQEHYKATRIFTVSIYLVIYCDKNVPAVDKRPFLVCGRVAIWLVEGEDEYPEESGSSPNQQDTEFDTTHEEAPELILSNYLRQDLEEGILPRFETLALLRRQYFPDARAIFYIKNCLLVELEETSLEAYESRLDGAPRGIANCLVPIIYSNGSLQHQGIRSRRYPSEFRLNEPLQEICDIRLEALIQNPHYEPDAFFQPGGVLVESEAGLTSIGVFLRQEPIDPRGRNGVYKLTTSLHGESEGVWVYNTEIVLRAEHEHRGSDVSVKTVTERAGSSNIGLVILDSDFPYRNEMLSLPGKVTRLVQSNIVCNRPINTELFWVDSFASAPILMAATGIRIHYETSQSRLRPPRGMPDESEARQLVFSVDDPFTNGRTAASRAAIAGAPVVRAIPLRSQRVSENPRPPASPPPFERRLVDDDVLTPVIREVEVAEHTGEVIGFVDWAASPVARFPGSMLCYADVVDGLVEDGWEVVGSGYAGSASQGSGARL